MKILFIDHKFHRVTNSSSFFIDILNRIGEPEFLFIDPQNINDISTINSIDFSKYKLVVLWQIDFLAPFFLGKQLKCVVVPMFDASGSLDQIHWHMMKGALVVCFSLHLYRTVALARCRAIYVKYFPDIIENNFSCNSNTNLDLKPSAFLWERYPDSKLNVVNIINVIKGIKWLHVHQFPDPGFKPSDLKPIENKITITVSNWFQDKMSYLQEVSKHDFFIASRYSEGIGLSFLEAMAMGLPIIAHDMATHNEYISNWKDGILTNYHNDKIFVDLSNISIDEINKFKQYTFNKAKNLRNLWIEYYEPSLIQEIRNYLNDNIYLPHFNYNLSYLGMAHINTYAYYSYLKKCLKKI